MPDEDPDQRPDAAPDLGSAAPEEAAPEAAAPVRKAPAKRAPAKKAAKRAPAKKAAKKAAPRASIMNRIAELEERYTSEPPPVAAEALARKSSRRQPAKAAPEAELGDPVAVVPAADAQADAPADAQIDAPTEAIPVGAAEPGADQAADQPAAKAELRPAKRTPVAVVPEVAQPTPQVPRAVPPPPPEDSLGEPAVRRPAGASVLTKALVAAIVLLLAAAGGMAAAAYVKNRPATWRAQATVALTPASGSGEDLGTAAARYAVKARSESFAAATATLAGVPDNEVREYIKADRGKPGEIVLEARAANADATAKLAEAASRQLVTTVLEDQKTLDSTDDRIGARVVVPTTRAVQEKPTDRSALLAALLAGVDIVLVAAMLGLFGKRPARRRR